MCMRQDLPVIRPAVPDAFIISANLLDQPHIASPEQAIAAGFELMNLGADAVYSGMSMKVVEAMAREYIPVIGHIGFVPYRSSWLGGTRAVGKTAEEAVKVYEAAKAYQDAGAIGVEIEIVPARVTEEIGKRLENLILISMGSGTGGTVQYLFATDVLGTNQGHIPRHARCTETSERKRRACNSSGLRPSGRCTMTLRAGAIRRKSIFWGSKTTSSRASSRVCCKMRGC
jgi:3-methyl-2-oxobutanoate hydroxymethyltransferase